MDTLPPFTEDLIKELDRTYQPIRAEEVLKLTDKELAFKAGSRAVVEYLLMVQERTKEDSLNVYSQDA